MQSISPSRVRLGDLGVANTVQVKLGDRISDTIRWLIPSVDETSPIGQKWNEKGRENGLGNPKFNAQAIADGQGSYQEFDRGAIFYSPAYGAKVISSSIFSKWSTLTRSSTSSGGDVQTYLGYPIGDSFGIQDGGQAVYFERGMIIVRGNGQSFVVYGAIYVRYRDLGDVNSFMGLPISDEEAAPGGGRRSRFDNADLYWRGDAGAFNVYGAIRERWLALGGSGGFLGYPLTDEMAVLKDGAEIGRFNRFQGGTIYWSPRTGAWDVYGAIRDAWENQYGGATGVLGFPTCGESSTPSSGGRFNNFERGIIVWHGGGPYAGTYGISSLDFYMDRFGSKGDDGLGGAQDVYVYVDVNASTGQRYNRRMPSDGDYGADEEIDRTFITVPNVRGDLVINVRLDGWDSDSGRPFDSDDRLGTVQERYSIDNLWGILEDATHWRGDFLAVYKIRSQVPIDPNKPFRQQYFWPFENFSTKELSWSQYAQTFRDVAEDESVVWHPFDHAFYQTVYKGIASGGNCFGMCLESVYAHVGRSIYAEPINRFGPRGSEPNPNMGSDREIINEINIKHGYQVAGGVLDWFLGKFVAGHTHDPVRAFRESRNAFACGDYPVMVVTGSSFNMGGHVVRPYRWDDSNPNQWIIYIADPNVPTKGDDDIRCRIEIDPNQNTFRYQHGSSTVWTGGTWSGGRMYAIPFSQLCCQPRTPFWEVLALLSMGTLILLGDDGQTQQISDRLGRTLFEPNLAALPDSWEQLRRDETMRIPNMTRVPLLNTFGLNANLNLRDIVQNRDLVSVDQLKQFLQTNLPELYYMRGTTDSIRHEIAGRQGNQYRWAMRSPALSVAATVTNTSGTDTMTIDQVGKADQSVALSSTGSDKQMTLALSGYAEEGTAQGRKFEVRNLRLTANQAVKARLSDGGQELLLENAGPQTNFDLYIQSGQTDQASAVRPTVTLEAGQVMRLRPMDWSVSAIASAPIQLDVLNDLRGSVLRRTML